MIPFPVWGVFCIAAAGVCSADVSDIFQPKKGMTTIVIEDGVGRQISVPYPLKRVVAASGSYGPETILALGAKDRLVGVGDYAKLFSLHIAPLVEDIPGIGLRDPSAEKILEIGPEAVIFYECYYPYPDALMQALDGAGIISVMMGFHRPEVFEKHIRIMGMLIEKEVQAEKLIDFEKQVIDRIEQGVGKIPFSGRPNVYLEQYYDFRTITPDSPDHALLTMCGGNNIFGDLPKTGALAAYISPETVIERNPDIIIKHISSSAIKNSGYGALDDTEFRKIRNRILHRGGWEKITAIKNNKVYILNTEVKATHASVYCAYFARWFHPEIFRDLNGTAIYREWMETFLNVPFKGVYAYPETEVAQ